MHENVGHACGIRFLRESNKVPPMTVHAAVGKQSQKMEPMAPRARESFLRDWIAREIAVGNRFVDPSEVLVNDAPSAEIEMADF